MQETLDLMLKEDFKIADLVSDKWLNYIKIMEINEDQLTTFVCSVIKDDLKDYPLQKYMEVSIAKCFVNKNNVTS